MAQLTLTQGGQVVWTHSIDNPQTRIGRDPASEIVIPDPAVSRLHAVIIAVGERHRIVDNSTNGIFVNGQRTQVALLAPRDEITIGPWTLQYGVSDQDESIPTTLTTALAPVVGYSAQLERLMTEQALLVVRGGGQAPGCYPVGSRTRLSASGRADVSLPAGYPEITLSRDARGYYLQAEEPVQMAGRWVTEAELSYGTPFELRDLQLELVAEEGLEDLPPSEATFFEGMVGASEVMKRLFTLVERVAPLDSPVVILGETGTGKDLVASALHARSGRSRKPYVALNCGAITAQLFESELFGHERGAFTGAVTARDGAFQQAHGGTLFLDEVGELPLDLQVKLLRVLETSEITRVGSTQARKVNTRIIAATHRNLEQEVKEGRFRADLFFRLFVIPIHVPPLRERPEDIPALVEHFLTQITPRKSLSREARRVLVERSWPGNVRELKHVLTRATAMAAGPEVTASDLQFFHPTATVKDTGTLLGLETMEKLLIDRALKMYPNRADAATALGIARSTLFSKIRKYNLE